MRTIACLLLTSCASTTAIVAPSPPMPQPLALGRKAGQRDFAMSQSPVDGRFVFTRAGADRSLRLMETRFDPRTQRFAPPRPILTGGNGTDADGFFDPRTGDLLFMSKRPHPARSPDRKDFDLWVVSLRDGAWGAPRRLDSVNTEHQEVFPTVDRQGVLYFASDRPGTVGGADLWRFYRGRAESLGPNINTPESDSNPLVMPSGDRVVFYSRGRKGRGAVDLWVVTRDGDGWSAPINVGDPVNTEQGEYAPGLSADGRTLFFSREEAIYAVERARVPALAD